MNQPISAQQLPTLTTSASHERIDGMGSKPLPAFEQCGVSAQCLRDFLAEAVITETSPLTTTEVCNTIVKPKNRGRPVRFD
jgi:hypothetical protein